MKKTCLFMFLIVSFFSFSTAHQAAFAFFSLFPTHIGVFLFFKRLYCRFFPVNFPKFLGPLYLQNTVGRVLLHLEPRQISMMELFCGNSKSLTVFEKKPSYMFIKILQISLKNCCVGISF